MGNTKISMGTQMVLFIYNGRKYDDIQCYTTTLKTELTVDLYE